VTSTPSTRRAGGGGAGDRGRPGAGGPEYRFFGGKGGTGKTTCAAAAAIAAAEAGRRVLVVSTDPAHSLGDALALPLGPRPRPVRTRRGRLDAVELDADRALAAWLAPRKAALRAIAERGTYLDDEDVERLFRLSLPGVDELIGLVELARLARAGAYERVVVDTAPTGHTLRLLAMPETVQRVAAVLDRMYAKHRFLAERLGGAYRPDRSDAVIAELDADGRDLYALLRDRRRARFVWLTLPEPLALEEARDGVSTLARWGLTVDELLVNRVTPPPAGRCRRCEAWRRAERAALGMARRALRGHALRFLPKLPAEPRGVGALRRVARHLAALDRGVGLLAGPGGRAAGGGLSRRRSTGAPAAWLPIVAPPGTRLLLFVGKGGVGKTTCAATTALELAAAAPAPRILLLSTDPAHSLGDVLGSPVGDAPRTPPAGPPALAVRELDAARAFHRRRAGYRAAVAELFGAVGARSPVDVAFDRAVVDDLIDLAPPGLEELFGVLSVTEALVERAGRPGSPDTVVVDTAPTGHTLRLLALPGAALEWTRALLAILLKYRPVIRPGRLAQELVALSQDLRALERLLHDRRQTRVVAVTRAGELPRRETQRLADRLRRLGMSVPAVVVNAVPPAEAGTCRRCAREAGGAARAIGALRARCRGRQRACHVIVAPEVVPAPRGVRALARWGNTWRSTRGGPGGGPAPPVPDRAPR
jgi:arsenite-transporting ATPase